MRRITSITNFDQWLAIWIRLSFLGLTIVCVNSLEVTLYDTSKLDSLGWTTYSPGLQADRLGWREASYSTTQGDVLRVYTICNIDYSVANNWARTPFLPRGEANRLYVNMRFTMRKCSRYPDPASVQLCKESFKLLFYESMEDFANGTSPSWDENTYRAVDIIPADRLFTDIDNATINDVTRSVTVTKRGVYLAFYDQGACMTLLSVRVYYVVCPDLAANLTIFNRTVTGPDLTSVVQTRAVCTSHAGAEQSLYALCKADGSWMDLMAADGCRCLPGYQPDAAAFRICSECPTQTYKSQLDNGRCLPCPSNSNTTKTGSTGCQCRDGYSRRSSEETSAPCTSSLGAVQNLLVTYINQTFVSLSWQPPGVVNGNDAIYYSVQCLSCDSGVVYLPRGSGLTVTSVSLSGLKPGTTYRVTVYTETDSTSDTTENRSSNDVTFTTTNPASGMPWITNLYVARIGAESVDLVWKALSDSSVGIAEVSAYEVRYLEMAANSTYSLSTIFPNASISRLLPDTVYVFKVRAKGFGGWGEFSNPVSAKTESSATYMPMASQSPNLVPIIAGTASGVIICVIIVAVVAVLLIYRRRKQTSESNSSDCDMLKYINGAHTLGRVAVNQSNSSLPSTGTDSLHIYADPYAYEDPSHYSRDRVCEIEPSVITIESILLKGSFGNICAGKLATRGAADIPVMIETLNENTSEDRRIHFLTKAEVILRLNHVNIIVLKGVVSKTTPHMIISEYMSNGWLNFFVKENSFRLTVEELVGMICGVASAMTYLTDCGFILRDLSSKSVLVNDNLTCKVTSFDMLCSVEDTGVHCEQMENLAVRWSAPEVLTQRLFSVASDVWSFGVVVWEVMSFGEIPYSCWSDDQVAMAVVNGNRLPILPNCPENVSQLMSMCWTPNPDHRPTFSALVGNLEAYRQTPRSLEITESLARPDSTINLPQPSLTSTVHRYDGLDLSHWLLSLQLACYLPNFHSQGFRNVGHILRLSEVDLERMGISNSSHQRTLLGDIQRLRTRASSLAIRDYYV